jgi:hypothetical protein
MQICRPGFDDEYGDGRVLREPCSQDEAGGLPIASALVCDRVCGTRTPPPATCYQIAVARKDGPPRLTADDVVVLPVSRIADKHDHSGLCARVGGSVCAGERRAGGVFL